MVWVKDGLIIWCRDKQVLNEWRVEREERREDMSSLILKG